MTDVYDPAAGGSDDAQSPPIRTAASLILIKDDGQVRSFLMGRRGAKAAFMPGKLVFPGGRIEASDARGANEARLICEADAARIAAALPDIAPPALPYAALRETQEETGLSFTPAAPMRLVVRAITPPGRTRRYDAWFFLADAACGGLEQTGDGDGELSEVNWVDEDALESEPLAMVTRFVLAQTRERLAAPDLAPIFLRMQGEAPLATLF